MAGFNFENDLPHQLSAIEDILQMFEYAKISYAQNLETRLKSNPVLELNESQKKRNLAEIQTRSSFAKSLNKTGNTLSNIFDIAMETGTGKTYTYTRAMFSLNQSFGVNKFIVLVPTVAIKAGTKNFLESASARSRFFDDFGKRIELYEVNAKKGNKKDKQQVPENLINFINANDQNSIHILLINMGMLNSETMNIAIDQDMFQEAHGSSFEALSAVKPFLIIDEPHRVKTSGKTWQNVLKLNAQYIVRFGATFDGFENLIHTLTSLDAFEQNLVKGVRAFITQFDGADDMLIKFIGQTESKSEAVFEITHSHKKTPKRLEIAKNGSLGVIHGEMSHLLLNEFNGNTAVLSNGLALQKGEIISPYSFSQSLQEQMLYQAVIRHFDIERTLLTRTPRIKPLSLIFIDDIAGYRDEQGLPDSLKSRFEAIVINEAQKRLANETNEFYKAYLQKTLADISQTHGGYFSDDNNNKDEYIEKQINEILHEKEKLLDLDNPRRFIFSKWTLREGWDNPNVFVICKLRSSGSETSKLQEVGRGLRLPVNEFMHREKGEQFYLNYFVDFSEKDFVADLIKDIREKSGEKVIIPTKLTDELLAKIMQCYPNESKRKIINHLADEHIIDDDLNLLGNGWKQLQQAYPKAFEFESSLNNKIQTGIGKKETVLIRKDKYHALKTLWETLNRRVVLNYQIDNEQSFYSLLKQFFAVEVMGKLDKSYTTMQAQELQVNPDEMLIKYGGREKLIENTGYVLSYGEFANELAMSLNVSLKSLHQVLLELNWTEHKHQTRHNIRHIHSLFRKWLLQHFLSTQTISYTEVNSQVHPTAFTDEKGNAKDSILSSDIGRLNETGIVADNYLFETLFYDSPLEKENILLNLDYVTVFTKIPKNTIAIPVAGGGTYSPDFAYVLHHKDGTQTLNLVVETKDAYEFDLRTDEKEKIKYAQILFDKLSSDTGIKVEFKTQFKGKHIERILEELRER
ncbi:type III restriction-modification system endonuclease [Glaesserella parasuis]|uniref:type III restriction-modification system endonuclease n=1 Tax=Glaesserella parasuis TaxID=738 RepID=UPI00094FE301|nr:type III restriction-modification system endonuclease [Glaesserella parasuis]MDG6248662.1 type III restriction-modification system endonuclease [Glaesserella parasuis]MDG6457203.1 type III restriction-modification system endonuclease [Glaesserella parasuis]MDG6789620.1 type III restriction-modification system endonuclease [Glaesserella parasuis]MDG6807399.1 type III restriction-modification system endonuclease [Glaesserella parasuis]MDP0207791.1 type III restriction-modification system endo